MSGRFPGKWYEWVLVSLSGILLTGQGFSSLTGLLSILQLSKSPLLPAYGIYLMVLKNLPVVISMLAGLCGIITCLYNRTSGWSLMMTGALFFIYLRLSFLLLPASAERLQVILIVHLLVVTGLLVLLLLRNSAIFRAGRKHYLFVLLASALLIFLHFDAYGISLFLATHL